ncbi:MAG: 30S ribosomal protein S17, partial [Christensenella sp.]
MSEEVRGYRKERVGTVVSDKMDKTIVVAIKSKKTHPLYGKIINYTHKFKAHDEKNEACVG